MLNFPESLKESIREGEIRFIDDIVGDGWRGKHNNILGEIFNKSVIMGVIYAGHVCDGFAMCPFVLNLQHYHNYLDYLQAQRLCKFVRLH